MSRIAIVKLVLRETRDYHEQRHRQWYTQVSQGSYADDFYRITERLERVQASDLAGVAGNLMRPAGTTGRNVDIPYGWDTVRLRWCMMVDVGGAFNAGNCVVLSGHTNHADIDSMGNPADDMEFIVNNSTITRFTESDYSGTMGRITNVLDAAHVLVPPEMRRGSGFREERHSIDLMTPMDIAGEITFRSLVDDGEDDEAEDLRNGFSDQQVRRSRRSNGLAPAYLASLTNGVRKVSLDYKVRNDSLNADDDAQFYARVRTEVREHAADKDDFMRWLEDNTDYKHHRTITWGELRRFFPDIESDRITTVIEPDSSRDDSRNSRGRGAEMNGSMPDQVAAHTLAFSVPAIMMDHMLQSITFTYSNMTRSGVPFVDILNIKSFVDGIDLAPYEQRFLDRLESEVMYDLTDGGRKFINLTMRADTLGESHIDIEIDGSPRMEYVIPSFADAGFSPVVTDDNRNLKNVSLEFNALLNPDASARPRNRRRGSDDTRGLLIDRTSRGGGKDF